MRRLISRGVIGLLGIFLVVSLGRVMAQQQTDPASGAQSNSSLPAPSSPDTTGGVAVPFKVCGAKTPPPCATPPKALFAPIPEYSDRARKARYEGVCVLNGIVEVDGHLSHIRVTQALGMGLDEKAIEAVKKWKFQPGTVDGSPVPVTVAVEVAFHLHK